MENKTDWENKNSKTIITTLIGLIIVGALLVLDFAFLW